MKAIYSIAVLIGGTVGGWLGAVLFDHGNWFGGWSILLTATGSFAGIWLAYKMRSYF
ncbi:MAG TPA: hypothetical protein VG992_04665 [Candidatus Saccharimonadales bacterium]|nr:hypothetical protein [Candidatus Saccharimonadales bacterium]